MSTQIELLPIRFPKEAYQFGQRSDGEIHGVVLTKPHIVELILDLAGYKADNDLMSLRLLEPSCGHGAFLVPAVKRLLQAFRHSDGKLSDLKSAVTAFDIDPEHVAKTKQTLIDLVGSCGYSAKESAALVNGWVFEGDFLLADLPAHFDVVVGNPPYIRIEQISPQLQAEYRRRYSSLFDRADLYVAFIEKSLSLLAPEGTLSFICADRWILNRYGAPLREKLSNGFRVQTYIDLHTASPFDSEVIAYPSIFVISPGQTENVNVFSLKTAAPKECEAVHRALSGRPVSDDAVAFAAYDKWFVGDEPWTLSSPEQLAALRDLESRFQPIEADGNTQVRIGVATGCDKLYIVDNDLPVEKNRLLPLVMRADLDQGKIRDSGKCVINTFEQSGGVVDLAKYPKLRKYFDEHADEIRRRHVAKKNESGWFRTIDRVYPELVDEPKLLIPDIAGSNEVTFDSGKYFPHHNLYFVISKNWDLEVLGGLLSSRVALFFVWSYAVKMRGGYLRFQAQYLRRIRVPRPGDLSKDLPSKIKTAFRKRDFKALDRLALQAYRLKTLPDFDFVDTRA
ncbi:MAG: Eco57I restriction-modification methylase domain-containing protein [Deltaproteobacteria bacterium]|nr:Eco57I restriction-modification methylase domain-containing protein [Deltaproteobacteria bacterium]